MFSMMESNLGYGASYTSASCRGAERDFIHQQVPATLSYSQMLRMSMEESTEDMGSSHDCALKSNEVYAASEEGYMGSCSECVLGNKEDYARKANMEYNEGARSMKGYSNKGACKGVSNLNVCVRQEEGFAENDYGFTCLTLGGGIPPCDRFDVPSFSPQNVSRNSSGFTRTCKLCGTAKTPLWRSGPMGAKSLCNACGIRSNKAKKLSVANEEEEQGAAGSCSSKSKGFLRQAASSKAIKRKKAELEAKMKKKKRKKNEAGESDGELAKEEQQQKKKLKKQQQQQAKLPRLHVNVSMNSTTPSTSSPVKTESSSCVTSRGTPSPCSTQRKPFPPVSMLSTQVPHACLHFDSMRHFDDCAFPKDEEQAAFLLMALSCGLVLA